MKLLFLNLLLLLAFFTHYATGQAIDSTSSNSSTDGISYSGLNNVVTNNSNNQPPTTGLAGTIRNTTNNILQRLEGPRDRVVEFIKPAVKSDFSRNVTNVLNSIWSRIQESNSSIIHNPLFKNAIVIPINTTLTRLREITARENETAEIDESNLEVINLNRPEDEAQFKEYLQSSSNSEEAVSNPSVIFLVRDEDEKHKPAASEETSERVPSEVVPENSNSNRDQPENNNESVVETRENEPEDKHDEVSNNDVVDARTEPEQIESSSRSAVDRELNPTKSKRSSRFMDNHYTIVTPNRIRHLFDNVQRHGMQECMALSLCEANCRPHMYNENRRALLKRLFDRVESFGSDHDDYDYYVSARRYGQQSNDRGMDDCRMCELRYSCPHDRDYLMDRFYHMGNFN